MPSFNNPKVTNPINSDVSEIRELLKIVAKQDYTGATDLPIGTKRIVDITGGVQLQKYVDNSWSSIGKLMHDVDQLDGYHASLTAVKKTIPVYNDKAQLVGDLTGNAGSATKLKTKRTIDIGGIAYADAVEFDGSSNITIPINSINVSEDSLTGIVPIEHGGTGRNDGVAADVLVSSLAGKVKASEYGQIGYTKFITSDLNTLTVPGHYLSNNATIELHYPVAQSQTIHTIHVYQQGTYIRQILRDHFSEWIRTSSNSGSSWTAWRCLSNIKTGSFYVYVSKSGSDDNTGMDSANPVLTINRAFEIINAVVAGNSSIIAYMRVGSGYWGNIQVSNSKYPIYIEDYSGDTSGEYSENFPSFGTITAKNSFLFVRNVVCNTIQSDASSYISIERYLRVSSIRSLNNSYITMAIGNYEISNSTVSYVFLADYCSALSINTDAKITIIENISPSTAFLGVSHGSYFGLNDETPFTIPEGVTVTCKKYSLYRTAHLWFYDARKMDDIIPGTLPGAKSDGVVINGLPYGGGASDEALMADLSWKPVLLQTGGEITGKLTITGDDLLKIRSNRYSIDDESIEADIFSNIYFVDKNQQFTGVLQSAKGTAGNSSISIITRSKSTNDLASISLQQDVNGNSIAYCPTPPDSAAGTEIVTAAWANKNIGSKLAGYLPLTGGTLTGNLAAPSIFCNRKTSSVTFGVGTTWNNGASLSLYGDTADGVTNGFELRTTTSSIALRGYPSGALSWNNKNLVRSVNGISADVNGNVAIVTGAPSVILPVTAYRGGLVDVGDHVEYNWYLKVTTPNYGGLWLVVGRGFLNNYNLVFDSLLASPNAQVLSTSQTFRTNTTPSIRNAGAVAFQVS